MNHPTEQNQENSHTHTSTLINLFEQKGYECKKISKEKDTIYVMKFELSQQGNPFEPKPKITAH
jgi:hypothetical protein